MKRILYLLIPVVLISLVSCTSPGGLVSSLITPQEPEHKVYPTVSALLTQTEQAQTTPSQAAKVTPSPRITGRASKPVTWTPTMEPPAVEEVVNTSTLPASSATPLEALNAHTSTADPLPCDLAQAGRPFDVTVPDDTQVKPGEYFTKTWRLVNGGNCVWDDQYAVIWFSGADMGTTHAQVFLSAVQPGESVDFSIDMQAPEYAGSYQSNWKLRNKQGVLFGIGPEGGSPFWVRVVVVPVDTPSVPSPTDTAVPTFTSTAAPLVYASGIAVLSDQGGLDVDSGESGLGETADMLLEWPDDNLLRLLVAGGARMLPVGSAIPDQYGCQAAALTTDPIPGEMIQPGLAVCVLSSQSLPGRVVIMAVDPIARQIQVEYTTWAVP